MNKLRSYLNKINFQIGRNPVIVKRKDFRNFIPYPYKAIFLLSADFELAWAWRYSKSSTNPYKLAINKANSARHNIPKILQLCEQYNLPITWFTVGHLFLHDCKENNGKAHEDIPRIKNFENEYWRFTGKDWFEYDPCKDYLSTPQWYAPDIINDILTSKTNHEIGCHTFSHIDCSEKNCPPFVLSAEIRKCKQIANHWGVKLTSFVHPAHTVGNIKILAEEGFTSYRSNNRNLLGFPKKQKNGIWEFEQTAEILLKNEWSENYHIYRYKKIIDRAIKSNTIAYLWFHPSFNSKLLKKTLPVLFEYIHSKKDILLCTTIGQYVAYLNQYHLENAKS